MSFMFFFFIILFISGCTGPSLLCKGFLQLWCSGFSLLWLLLLQSSGSELRLNSCGAPSLSCSEACGIFPDQESNLCPLCWQAGSFPLCYQGSPLYVLREKDSSCEPAILAYLHMVTTVLEGENGFLKEKNHNHLPNTHTYNDLQAPKSGLIQRTVHFWSLDVRPFHNDHSHR